MRRVVKKHRLNHLNVMSSQHWHFEAILEGLGPVHVRGAFCSLYQRFLRFLRHEPIIQIAILTASLLAMWAVTATGQTIDPSLATPRSARPRLVARHAGPRDG